MRFAFCIFKYFPFGGLQRDFFRVARACLERGHLLDVYTWEWEGDRPGDFNVTVLSAKGMTNHRKRESFSEMMGDILSAGTYDAVVGFNRMPHLDVYFAGDVCYRESALKRNPLYRMTPRHRSNIRLEESVYGGDSKTVIMYISEYEKMLFMRHYGTAEERFRFLPPGIAKDRLASANGRQTRSRLRRELNIGEKDLIVLMVGSDFRRKGVDRAILAMGDLPAGLVEKTHLLIIGKDRPRKYERLAARLGVSDRVRFAGGRGDVPRFLAASDLLVHPAYQEAAGMVLIEGMAAGLPVLVTEVCGYSHHIRDAGAGMVVPSPFDQRLFNRMFAEMLTSNEREQWKNNGLSYVGTHDVFGLPEKAADIIETVAKSRRQNS